MITIDPRKTATGLCLELHTPCRKCDACRRARQSLWSFRAKAETQLAPRTWFGTITLNPEAHRRFLAQARVDASAAGLDLDLLPFGEQFKRLHAQISRQLTKYIKRVREESNAPIRYLLVAETHKSGIPHYHMLLHEVDADKTVKHACLEAQWPFGFTKWKLVTDYNQATYLCKYLSKSAVARVRASVGYGSVETTTISHHSFPQKKRANPDHHEGTGLTSQNPRDQRGEGSPAAEGD